MTAPFQQQLFYFEVFMVQTSVIGVTAITFSNHQNGKYLSNLWSSAVLCTMESAHKFYSIDLNTSISTLKSSGT